MTKETVEAGGQTYEVVRTGRPLTNDRDPDAPCSPLREGGTVVSVLMPSAGPGSAPTYAYVDHFESGPDGEDALEFFFKAACRRTAGPTGPRA